MRTSAWAVCLAIGAIGVGSANGRPAPRQREGRPKTSPPFSFLPHQPQTVSGLLKQLNGSPELQQRYANHFHTSTADVMTFFRKDLVAQSVPQTRPYTVWMSRADGRKYTRRKTYKKGERILALKDGTPVLSAKCGNPFISHIKFIKRKPGRQSIVKPMTMSRNRRFATVTPFEGAGGFVSEAPYELPLDIRFADVPLGLVRSRKFIPIWWKTGHSHPEVPEPGTLAFLAVGALPLLALARKKLA